MKTKTIRKSSFCLSALALLALTVPCAEAVELREGEEHPDWATLCQTKPVKIPVGKTYVVYEEDMAYINAMSGHETINVQRGSTLVLDDTTTWFNDEALYWMCKGTIVKRGTSTLRQTTGMYFFAGKYIVENGVLEKATDYLLDGSLDAGVPEIVVMDGATLKIDHHSEMGAAKVTLSGNGYQNQGALYFTKAGTVHHLVLSNDTKIVQDVSGTCLTQYTNPGSGRGATTPGAVEMNGYTLTLAGAATQVNVNGLTFTGGGVLDLASDCTFKKVGQATDFGSTLLQVSADVTLASGEWSNTFLIDDGRTLFLSPTSEELLVSGNLGGLGNISCGTSDTPASGTVQLSGTNTYAGTTTVYGDSSFNLALVTPIADASKLTVVSGKVAPLPLTKDDGSYTWTAADLLAYAKGCGMLTNIIDTTYLTGSTPLAFSSSLIAEYFPEGGPVWGATGTADGSYTLTGPFTAARPLELYVTNGKVRLSGSEPITLGPTTVSGSSASTFGTLVLDGASDVLLGEDEFTIGLSAANASTWYYNNAVPRVIVTNSTLRTTVSRTISDNLFKGTIYVGRHRYGVLEVEAGSVISNRLMVGGGTTTTTGTGVGGVYQRGGLVRPCGYGGGVNYASNVGNVNHGSYLLSGGELHPASVFAVSGYQTGVFVQTGGKAWYDKGSCTISCDNGGNGTYAVLGGLSVVTNGQIFSLVIGSGSSKGLATLTVQGPNSVFSARNASYGGGNLYFGGSSGARAIFNLNDGGLFEYGSIDLYRTSYTSTYPLIFNFNGGTLRTTTSVSCFGINEEVVESKVVVYEKGATFATLGNTTFHTRLGTIEGVSETGGIKALALPEGGLTGYPAVPYVSIDCAGAYGASAVALVDPKTSTVTNIVVTSAGWDYVPENTTVRLCYGSSTMYTFPASAVTIENNVAGGFTFLGPGTMKLRNANTWKQWTRILGGKILQNEKDALPSDTVLTLSNAATLDLNGYGATFTGLRGTGGTVLNGSLVLTDGATVSARQFIDRETTAITGTLDLSGVTTLALTDTACLTEEAKELSRLNLFTATDVILPAGGVSVTGVPDGWMAQVTEQGLRLVPRHGMMLILR